MDCLADTHTLKAVSYVKTYPDGFDFELMKMEEEKLCLYYIMLFSKKTVFFY